jgi:hypothetical protein
MEDQRRREEALASERAAEAARQAAAEQRHQEMLAQQQLEKARKEAAAVGTEVEYDKFHDMTHARLELSDYTSEAGTHLLSIWAHHDGKEPKAPARVVFRIHRYGPHWEYLNYHDVVVMCGEERLEMDRSDYSSKVDTKTTSGNYCDEHFHIWVHTGDMQKILELGRDLEVKIGSHKPFTLDAETRDKMLRFTKAVRSGAY